uniref:Uncharacterized protein n=1 Tax=Panagrolaimus sp. JU765 TaxID=591449 RepID=A0AC34QQ80_9BILA
MKLFIFFAVFLVVGILAEGAAGETTEEATAEPTTTTLAGQPTTTAEAGAETTTTGSTSAEQSTPTGGQSSEAPTTTTLPPTTTTPPLDRNVSFKIDCSNSEQCSFEFRIAEPLMRFINQTQLEGLLGDLASQIGKINSEVNLLKTQEATYQTFLENEVSQNIGNFTETLTRINDTIGTIEDLQSRTDDVLLTAERFLNSSICFQNDADTSEGCGNLAFPNTTGYF